MPRKVHTCAYISTIIPVVKVSFKIKRVSTIIRSLFVFLSLSFFVARLSLHPVRQFFLSFSLSPLSPCSYLILVRFSPPSNCSENLRVVYTSTRCPLFPTVILFYENRRLLGRIEATTSLKVVLSIRHPSRFSFSLPSSSLSLSTPCPIYSSLSLSESVTIFFFSLSSSTLPRPFPPA